MHSLQWIHISVILILDTFTAHPFPLSTPYALQAISAQFSNQNVLLSTLQSSMHFGFFFGCGCTVLLFEMAGEKGGNTYIVIFVLCF